MLGLYVGIADVSRRNFQPYQRENWNYEFMGIVSALVLRAAMVLGGAVVLASFHWLIYVFGAFLILTGIKLYP